MQELPPVTLDTTLGELYARGSGDADGRRIAMVLCAANSEIAPTSRLSRNTKYLYQDSTFSTKPKITSPEQEKDIQRAVAVKYLSLVPQHDAFAAGKMPVILFNLDNSEANADLSKQEAEKTMSSLTGPQRPSLVFLPNPEKISMAEIGADLLAAKMEFDQLEGFPLALDLDTHYFLNSKAALCTSGLPTPKSVLLELNDLSVDPRSCCKACRSDANKLSVSSDCTGPRRQWLQSQISRLLSQISEQRLPFVLKNQQTFGGGGTFVVASLEDLPELKRTLSTQTLPKLLSQVTSSNAHLKPATLILSEMIQDPVGDWGLTFFVTKAGECIFLAVTQQVVDSTKAWIGSTVSYTAQDDLKQKFTPIMQEIGTWLYKYGYYGPCGADILEAAPKDKDDDGSTTLNIVDLNVRTSGSLVLGLMRGHFSKRRGLHEASSFSVNVKMGRESFIKTFEGQFREGKIVIVSWYEDIDSGVSYGNVVIGAQDKQELEKQGAKVKALGSEIHF